MRKYIIAGNWKMNNNHAATSALLEALLPKVANAACEVVVCPPYTSLCKACELTKGSNVAVGAQNINANDKGAYTGDVSADMLLELGVKYVIIGHSERRQYNGETDETVNAKALTALSKGLIPIICVGESLHQRKLGITNDLVRMQTRVALLNMTADQVKTVVIAYEPIWAIGTGETATEQQAEEVCKAIRDCVRELYDDATADAVRIQYGGSMNAANAATLLSMPNIDGGLIGGASLKADDFATIVAAAK